MKGSLKNFGTTSGKVVKWCLGTLITLAWIALCIASLMMISLGLITYGGLLGLVAIAFLVLILFPLFDGMARTTGKSQSSEHVVNHPWSRRKPRDQG